ncbi:unnamed protein product [Didymodactylos carnosus]|uniref:Uncharacterized protein n=1 Tax=Didymodactylos carnosus TaxID=1234261 RepID=A0A815IDK7_9BILA|nr:unnamed protein product [Didymodactylos carnosus]CAF4244791.1 unnamed protein product [Didymodactylos carnosus]
MFPTCQVIINTLLTLVKTMKNESNQNDCDGMLHTLEQQVVLLNEQHDKFTPHHLKLEEILSKQQEALNLALNFIIHQANV